MHLASPVPALKQVPPQKRAFVFGIAPPRALAFANVQEELFQVHQLVFATAQIVL